MRIKWYTIPEHPNYELNRLGQVRNRRTGKILQPFDDGRGYLRVTLDGVNVKLHILVASMFVENPDPAHKTVVNHKKGNKHDPRASQLEWVTQSENIKHAWNTGLIKKKKKGSPNSTIFELLTFGLRNICSQDSNANMVIW